MKLFSLTLISVLCCSLSSCVQNKYTVMTVTKDGKLAGSGAKAYITLNGIATSIPKHPLNGKDEFRPREANFYFILAEDIGAVKTIKIDLDFSKSDGNDDFWLLKGVYLFDEMRHLSQWYECNNWLNASRKQSASQILIPSPSNASDYMYKVMVETGNDKDAGTHGKVYITLLGSEGNSRKILLDHEGKPEFQRGQTDTFNIRTEYIGDVTKIRIELDSTAESNSPNWFLKAVSLVNEESKQDLWFPWNQWLTPTAHQKTISVEIPISTKKGKQ